MNDAEKPFIDKVLEEYGVKMEYPIKVSRAVFGMPTSRGLEGGVGTEVSALVILSKYDQLGGYMTDKNGHKIKNGSFFDKKTKAPVVPKSLTLIVKVNGEFVEHVEGQPESLELSLAKKQEEEKVRGRGRPPKQKVEESVNNDSVNETVA